MCLFVSVVLCCDSVCMRAMVMLFLWPLGPWGAHCVALHVVGLCSSVLHHSICVIAWVIIHVIMFCVMILVVNLMFGVSILDGPFRGLG